MKEFKNKEILLVLIILIILLIVAIALLLKRENGDESYTIISEEKYEYQEYYKEEPNRVDKADKTQEKDSNNSSSNDSEQNFGSDNASGEDLEESGHFEITEKLPDNIAIMDEPDSFDANTDSGKNSLLKTGANVAAYHTEPVLIQYKGEDMWQLEEIFHYWDEYKLEAVSDLIHLPRVRTLTNELSGTNGFYYFGETDSKGNPNGKGLAVYENNSYYCGEWKEGKRSGKGMFWMVFPDKTGTINGVSGIKEHVYNGSWANDYPNGEGQEHYGFDYEELSGEDIIANVIGNFKNGYYDGELYIMTVNPTGTSYDWEAKAENGVYAYCNKSVSASGRRAVWENMKPHEDGEEFYWLFESENKGFGIYGLKKK